MSDEGQTEQQGEILPSEGEEICHDPGKWPAVINPGLKDTLVQGGPHQTKGIIFPKDSWNRRFSEAHYSRTLANGEKLDRPWLVYSISKDATFCFCCKLFCESERKSALAKDGVLV